MIELNVWNLFLLSFLCFLLVWLIDRFRKNRANNLFKKIIGFTPTFQQAFITDKSGITGIAIDDSNRKIALAVGRGKPAVYNYEDIENAEVEVNETLIQTSSVGSQATRGVVGFALLGPAGLLIGALSGKKDSKKYVNKLSLKISINDLENPIFRIIFYDGEKVDFQSVNEKKWAKDAERWIKRISQINSKLK
jgi:hypothetical protein